MGVVYKAIDTKLGRAVALKFLPPQWSHDEGAQQRFLREAQAASATNHRNICIIHDIEHTGDGQLFIVMAYYEGQTLKEKLEGGALPFVDALDIATEVAEGLAKAHAQGVVHRDVKPGNLMITDDGVKVLDFGLAKFADSLQLTMPGSTIGTVAYMSPEQARGEEADARSDVWALGVVMYEMLAGRVPFSGAYPEATFHAIKNEPVPPLSRSDREIPVALQTLVSRALEKDPERRYQTAREMARDLRLLQGRTVPIDLRTEQLPALQSLYGRSQAAPPEVLSWPQRARRAMTPVRAAVIALVIAAISGGTYLWTTRPVIRIPIAVAPVANHTGEPELDAYRLALTEMLIEELEDSPNVRVVSFTRLLQSVRRFLGGGDVSSSEAIQAIATQSGASYIVIPSLEYRDAAWLARVQIRNAETGTVTNSYETEAMTSSLPKDTALRQLPLVAEKIQAHFKENGPGRSYAGRPAAARVRNLDAARAFTDAMSAYEAFEYSAALADLRRAAGADDQNPMIQAWSSRVLLLMNDRDGAIAAARQASQLSGADAPPTDASFIAAVLSEAQSDAVAAERRYRAAADRRPDDVTAKIELADFLKRQSQNQAAIGAYQDALGLDGQYGRLRVDLCQLYARLVDYPLAEEQARAAIETFRGESNQGGEAQALLCLGDVQRVQGGPRLVDARRNIESARAIFESLGYQYGLSRVHQYLGLVSAGERDYPAAAAAFEHALTASRAVGNRSIEGLALINLGVSFEMLGQRTKVLNYYQEARDFYQRAGDEGRAAEQEANAAGLLIDYGTDQETALRRILNARATFEKLGNIEFQVATMEMEAASLLHRGLHDPARRQLRTALSLAKERQFDQRWVYASLRLAESYVATAEYEAARTLLEETAATEVGRDELAVSIALGRTYARLGDLENARARLGRALMAVEASGQLWLEPSVHLALGELEFDAGNISEARARFDAAAASWTDDLPDAGSIEARCFSAALDPRPGNSSRIALGIEQARKMGRLSSQAECLIAQARVSVSNGRHAEALAALDQIPLEGERTVGSETAARVHYWRGRARSAAGDRAGAESEASQAHDLIENVRLSLPPAYRDRYAARAGIHQISKQ